MIARTALVVGLLACSMSDTTAGGSSPDGAAGGELATQLLDSPRLEGPRSLEASLAGRRSVRSFQSTALTLQQVSQLLWAAQGVTDPERGLRAAPSAGALYPLEIDLIVFGTEGLEDGMYRYIAGQHQLRLRQRGDLRPALQSASLGQGALNEAPVVLVLWGVPSRTAARYGGRASRYVYLEAGHAAQNALLQAEALGLAGVPIGAFDDAALHRALGASPGEEPLYLLPFGRPAEQE